MEYENLSPEQMVQATLLGLVILSMLMGGILAFGVWVYRSANGIPFSLARAPLATVGLIDILFAGAVVVLLIVFVQMRHRASEATPSQPEALARDSTDDHASRIKHHSTPFVPQGRATPLASPSDKRHAYWHSSPSLTRRVGIGDSLQSIGEERVKHTVSNVVFVTNAPTPHPQPLSPKRGEGSENLKDATSPISAEVSTDSATQEKRWGKMTAEGVVWSGVVATMQLVVVAVVILFIRLRTECRGDKLGWQPQRLGRDIGVGVWLLFLTLPLLMVLSGVVNYLSGVQYDHPVIDMMKEVPWLFGIIAWMAVIAAPISEEFFFRTMLIGWFESIHFGRTPEAFVFGYSPVDQPSELDAPATSDKPPVSPWWPAVLSGTLFGLAHGEYGLSWIPLILFGIVLGRIYQLRQSIVTCITIHMLFNGINLLNLWLSIGLK